MDHFRTYTMDDVGCRKPFHTLQSVMFRRLRTFCVWVAASKICAWRH